MELEKRILNFLLSQHLTGLRGVEVVATGGSVVLRGRVLSDAEKQLCVHCCAHVAGVIHVTDLIEVISRD